ncbi:MAG: CRTAC1 family protein [Verrucomicrobiaceae bacterium]|nr:CRTAC1 family protein [Verrucomicrobiaceae bacterium]
MPLGNSGASPGLVRSSPAQALIEAVRRGSSFSGNERHVVFQNIAGRKFSDVSGITGLDLADDGRAVCFTDWDNDGDLDLWINNRNSPQVRFFRNNNPGDMRGLTVRLVGSTCPRDAIGARAILYLKGQKPQTQSVTAGSGFLAQSSKTLHFGLAEDAKIEKLVVHWPGAEAASYPGLAAGSLIIRQGETPQPLNLKDPALSNTPVADASSSRHTFLAQRLPTNTILPRPSGKIQEPSLVVLASKGCPNCEIQLAEWRKNPPQEIAINVLYAEKLHEDNPLQLQLIQLLHDHFFYITQRSLETPLSFLVDPEGRLCAIYRGRIDRETLKKDTASLKIDGAPLRMASLPFKGHWQSGSLPEAEPLGFAEELLDAGLVSSANLYIREHFTLMQSDEAFPQLLERLKEMENK